MMKKWCRVLSFFMTLILLFQAVPVAALAEDGSTITESELMELISYAGLQVVTSDGGVISLEAEESGYHAGMQPDDTWNVRMLMDYLDNMLKTEIYSVTSSFSSALTILKNLETESPTTYARLTSGTNQVHYEECQEIAQDAEEAEQEARLLHTRMTENLSIIEQVAPLLLNINDLFDYERIRYSQQLQDAVLELDELEEDILAFVVEQMLVCTVVGRSMLDGSSDPSFSAWHKEIIGTLGGSEQKTVAIAEENNSTSLMARLSPVSRALADNAPNEATILVLNKEQFAIVLQDKDHKGIPGISVTVKDLNSPNPNRPIVKTLKTAEQGNKGDGVIAAVFNCSDFVVDFEEEMELEITVDGSAQGYRSFYIPWALVKAGSHRNEILTKLTEPASGVASSVAQPTFLETAVNALFKTASADTMQPYVYSATFNDMDIWRTDKVIRISSLNDNSFNFAIEVENPGNVSYQAPEFHYWVHEGGMGNINLVEKTMKPTSSQKVTSTRTKYLYTAKWKQILSPDAKKEQRPYFYFPSSKEKLQTQAQPLASTVDQPTIMDTGSNSPLRKVFGGDGFGLNFTLPKIGGTLGFNVPFGDYLPKVAIDDKGYITVTVGSSLVDPKKTEWKNAEQERYDKGMKQFEHESSKAGAAQKLGTASKYYKYMGMGKQAMKKASLNLGWFMMLAGKWEKADEDDGSSGWNAGGAVGMTVTFSFDYTQPGAIGPVPFYININFSVSAGFGATISYRLERFKDGRENHSFDLGGLVIEIRLAITVSVGVGIKGIASLWVAATGSLNITLSFIVKQPVHVAVTLGFTLSIGFEFFFITYSKALYDMPPFEIYKNYNDTAFRLPFGIMSALANTPSNKVDETPMTPERYPQLAPQATEIKYKDSQELASKTFPVKLGGREFVISLMQEKNGTRFIKCLDTTYNWSRKMPDFLDSYYASILKEYEPYDIDVYNDGSSAHLVILMAPRGTFDSDGLPQYGYIRVIYLEMTSSGFFSSPVIYDWPRPDSQGGRYNITKYNLSTIISSPHIESAFIGASGGYEIYGTLKGNGEDMFHSQYNVFCILPHNAERKFRVYGDVTVSMKMDYNTNNKYRRSMLRSNMRNAQTDISLKDEDKYSGTYGFVALDTPIDGNGDSYLILSDYLFSHCLAEQSITIDDYGIYIYKYTDSELRHPIVITQGKIKSFEMLQTLGADKKSYSQTIFYMQEESIGYRTINRLKGVKVSPKRVITDYGYFDIDFTYTDYDLTIPASEFKTVSIGASQYLYWLSTVPKQKDSDPDMWRISGLYYDSSLDVLSDEIVIAEFSLPKINGRRAVPGQITLTDQGLGYIMAYEDNGTESGNHSGSETKLYRFNISLKAVGTLQGAALMENVVSAGDTIATDLTLMNEGNMGIGSFIVDVMQVSNGRETLVETLYANCMNVIDSKIVMANGRTVSTGERAFYRYKDFLYAPRQNEWILARQTESISVRSNTATGNLTTTTGTKRSTTNTIKSNVLVPGTLGGYSTNIKIPDNWAGTYKLRLKLRQVSTYANWLKASVLAQERPELFAFFNVESPMVAARNANTLMNLVGSAAEKAGLQRMVYELDEEKGKMVLQNPETLLLMKASSAGTLAVSDEDRDLLTFNSVYTDATEEGSTLLYPMEIEASDTVDVDIDVHDINVGHRVYTDYYGAEQLEITVHNYYQSNMPMRLYCTIYDDDSLIGRNFQLPYEMEYVASGKTQTITLPLSSMVDTAKHEKIRVVIKAIGMNDETASLNNEFEVYIGGTITPESTATPVPIPKTGDSANLALWIGLVVFGLAMMGGVVYLTAKRKKKEE